MKGRIKIYSLDDRFIHDVLIDGGEHQSIETDYTENDFLLSFFKEKGLWESMIGSRPRGLKQDNGYPWILLQQVGILHELSQTGKLIKVKPIISDGKLMASLGFNMEYVEKRQSEAKGVLHEDTLRNHYKRKDVSQSLIDFYRQVALLRENKWLRGGNYVADGFKIKVFGKTFEGMGEVWNSDSQCWEYGYKAVLIMNVEAGRERVVGIALDSIATDERELLRRILKDIEKHVCSPKEMIDLLILDRGYWGMDFLSEIYEDWKIDFLIMAKKNLEIVTKEIPMVMNDLKWVSRTMEVKDRSKKIKKEKLKLAKYEGIGFKVQRERGAMTAVLEKGSSRKKSDDALTIFLTTQKVKEPLTLVKQYKRRWVIENEGIRELSQKHKIRELGGRTLNPIMARMTLALMTYNALKIFKMKWNSRYEEMRQVIKKRRRDSWLKGKYQVIVYVKDRFAIYSVDRYHELGFEGGERTVLKKLIPVMERAPPELKKQFDHIINEIFQKS